MEKNKSSLYPIVAGIIFALLGVLIIERSFAPIVIISALAHFVIAFALFTKRRDIVLPIGFAVLVLINLLDLRYGMIRLIATLLYSLAKCGLILLCLGEFTNYIKNYNKDKSKKLWIVPAIIYFVAVLLDIMKMGKLGFLDSILSIIGYVFVGAWIVYPDGLPKKVYNVITTENAGIGVDVDTENIINSLYECYCENVKRGLKAPATAVFCKPEELQIKEFEGVYTVSGWVDSQNSYGAMIRTPFTLKMKNENGKIVSTTNINMLGSKRFAANYFTYLLFGIIITAILFGISYFFISGMF